MKEPVTAREGTDMKQNGAEKVSKAQLLKGFK